MSSNPHITFVIPIFNSAQYLTDCLESIKRQRYSQKKIEIICPDGGSKDDSAEIVKKYGGKVIPNSKVLAEPGFMEGAKRAQGELIVYIGADNRLVEKDWIKKMTKPFENPSIIGAYSWHRNKKKNTWLTKYFNAFTDPINAFVLGDAANIRTFKFAYKVKLKAPGYIVYDFSSKNIPLLAFDQGFTVRKTYRRPLKTEYDDILPVIDMIEKKMNLAFVPGASNFHYTLEKGLPQFSKKMRWIIDNNISGKARFGFPTRKKKLKNIQKIRLYVWPLYALTIVLPLLHSIFGFLRDGRKEWVYHAPITVIMLGLVIFEFIRLKILKRKSIATRY